jgi:sodium/potassium-transporting ATPase subunit alpha
MRDPHEDAVPVPCFAPDEALVALRSSPAGLSAREATARLATVGPNAIEGAPRQHWSVRLAAQFTHLFARILWLAAALAIAVSVWRPDEGMLPLAAAIVAVIVVNGLFSFWQEHRAERALEALERLLPTEVIAFRDGVLARVPAAALVPGDVYLVEAGQRVPADSRVLRAVDLRVNNATLTGESEALPRDERPTDDADALRATNMLLAGTSVVSGTAHALAVATGSRTEFARIAALAQSVHATPSPLHREIAAVSRTIALIASGIGGFFFVANLLRGLPLTANLLFVIGVIVANVPEGLLPTLTLALAMAAQRMARRNVIVRHLPAVEALGTTTVICTDKTGTLTENRMEARAVYVDGHLHDAANRDLMRGLAVDHAEFFEALAYCESAPVLAGAGGAEPMGDAMEVALLGLARDTLPVDRSRERLLDMPFDAERRRATTVYATDDGAIAYCKGALESLLPLCATRDVAGVVEMVDEKRTRRLRGVEGDLASHGLRVLAVAHKRVPRDFARPTLEEGLTFDGLVALEDPPRDGVPDAVRRCHTAGLRVLMLTGDHPRTALAIARQTGIVHRDATEVVTGDELAEMDDAALDRTLAGHRVFARLRADQKMRIVTALRRQGEVVAVTGDGVNDAPALRVADIGIAMGRSGTDVARESADLVLADDNFASIVAAVEEGRAVYANIRKFLTLLLSANVAELIPYLAFVTFRIPLPLTVLQILSIDLGSEVLPSLALGAEPPEHDQMRRPPRGRNEKLLSMRVLMRAYALFGPLMAGAGLLAYWRVLAEGGWHPGKPLALTDPVYLAATGACLAGIVGVQAVTVFMCRSEHASAFRTGARNPLIIAGVAVQLLVLTGILYTAVGNRVFATAPLPAWVWLDIVPFAIVLLLGEELRKWVVRRMAPAPRAA